MDIAKGEVFLMKFNNKLLLICILGLFCITQVQAIEIQTSCYTKSEIEAPQDALRYKQHVNNLHAKRAVIYNALDLSDEQIATREAIIKENSQIYEAKFNELIKESYTLKSLKVANADTSIINQQKKVVKNLKKEIDELIKTEDKEFKKSLTREQRSKFSMIAKLERNDFKAISHQKDYYKSNPRMRQFGNPQPQK